MTGRATDDLQQNISLREKLKPFRSVILFKPLTTNIIDK